jgi:chemotaxis protein methyltransferase CheR
VTITASPPDRPLSLVTGLDLASYRAEHVTERVRRALERENVPDIDALVQRLRSDPTARSRFRRSVAVSVSGLFRDPQQFELLERELLPRLVDGDRRLTIWSAGCANGSELYSVAILLERLRLLDRSLLVGSDLLDENLEEARHAAYLDATVSREVRARPRWERRDLVRDGALTGRWRLVLCRNVAIYLAPDAKQALVRTLAEALSTGGVLLLGRSERIADPAALGLEAFGPHAYRRVA